MKIEAQRYRDRARDYFHAMSFLAEDMGSYGHSVALLAVHSGISLSDAILLELTGRRSTAQDHHQAADLLRRVCARHRRDPSGVAHFAWLLEHKDRFAYGDERLDIHRDVKLALSKSSRMMHWFTQTFKDWNKDSADADKA